MSKPAFSNVFELTGRRNRKSYIFLDLALRGLVTVIGTMIVLNGDAVGGGANLSNGFVILAIVYAFEIPAAAQRFRDFGLSGWFAATVVIPFVSFFATLALWFVPGDAGENRYGPDPLKEYTFKTSYSTPSQLKTRHIELSSGLDQSADEAAEYLSHKLDHREDSLLAKSSESEQVVKTLTKTVFDDFDGSAMSEFSIQPSLGGFRFNLSYLASPIGDKLLFQSEKPFMLKIGNEIEKFTAAGNDVLAYESVISRNFLERVCEAESVRIVVLSNDDVTYIKNRTELSQLETQRFQSLVKSFCFEVFGEERYRGSLMSELSIFNENTRKYTSQQRWEQRQSEDRSLAANSEAQETQRLRVLAGLGAFAVLLLLALIGISKQSW